MRYWGIFLILIMLPGCVDEGKAVKEEEVVEEPPEAIEPEEVVVEEELVVPVVANVTEETPEPEIVMPVLFLQGDDLEDCETTLNCPRLECDPDALFCQRYECFKGECLKLSVRLNEVNDSCEDDIYQYGRDYCKLDGDLKPTILMESVCIDGEYGTSVITCPEEAPYCNWGECTSIRPTCQETDGGMDPEKLGFIVTNEMPGFWQLDKCFDIDKRSPSGSECIGENCGIMEYYCSEESFEMEYKIIPCPKGCNEGTCATDCSRMPDEIYEKDRETCWEIGQENGILSITGTRTDVWGCEYNVCTFCGLSSEGCPEIPDYLIEGRREECEALGGELTVDISYDDSLEGCETIECSAIMTTMY